MLAVEKVFTGSLPEIIQNDDNLYEGDLAHYFKVLFNYARNLAGPYHNFRHMFHVMYLCYDACVCYKVMLSKREMRNLLIAALFHDFDHTGRTGNDDLNIELAIRGLRKHIAPIDEMYFGEIVAIIRPTEYPHKVSADLLDLSQKILRDADVSQAFSVAWIQQVIIGLSVEMNSTPTVMLNMQEAFIANLQFSTSWARKKFDDEKQKKIEEVRGLLALLV
jgi:hypothetical protein